KHPLLPPRQGHAPGDERLEKTGPAPRRSARIRRRPMNRYHIGLADITPGGRGPRCWSEPPRALSEPRTRRAVAPTTAYFGRGSDADSTRPRRIEAQAWQAGGGRWRTRGTRWRCGASTSPSTRQKTENRSADLVIV